MSDRTRFAACFLLTGVALWLSDHVPFGAAVLYFTAFFGMTVVAGRILLAELFDAMSIGGSADSSSG